MRTLLRALVLLALALCAVLLTACETCETSGERRCGDGEILTCVDSPDATSSFEIASPCGDLNPSCVEDATAYPPIAACVLEEGQNGCNTCQDARHLRTCSMVGTRPVVVATDCRAQYPDPNFPGLCDAAFGGCRQCNPGLEDCDGSCTPGETRCLNGQLGRCNDDGSTWRLTACAGYNAQCFEDTNVAPRQAACVYQSYATGCPQCVDGATTTVCQKIGAVDVVIAFDCREIRADNSCSAATGNCVF